MPHPAGQGLAHPRVMPLGGEGVGRGPRAAVQIFITAAYGEVRARAIEIDLQRTAGMAEIPKGQGADGVRPRRQPGHVEDVARHIVHMGQDQQRDLVGDGVGDRRTLHHPQLRPPAELLDQPLQHVEIGGEVARLRQDHPPVGAHGHRRARQLEEVDGGGVRDRDLVRLRPDQARDATAKDQRRIDPAFGVPGPDQPLAPGLARRLIQRVRRRAGERPERIAVEIDHALRQVEPVPDETQRIVPVHRRAGVAGHRHRATSSARAAKLASQWAPI